MGTNDKVAATYHPDPAPQYECTICERVWGNADSARHCCGDWVELGED